MNDFFAPLVLEVDVDIRRLVALARNETLHQQAGVVALRVDGRDAEAVTHHGVRRGATPLAKNFLFARVANDVLHREEERFVLQVPNDRQLVLDGGTRLPGHALRPLLARALFHELTQITRRRFSGRHELVRILVLQFFESERAATRDSHRLGQQLGWIQARELRLAAQMTFAVLIEPPARFRQRHGVANGGEQVLELAAFAHVHVDVARGDERHRQLTPDTLQLRETLAIAPFAQQLDSKPDISRKKLLQPRPFARVRLEPRQPENETTGQQRLHIDAIERVGAFRRIAPTAGDEPAQLAVAVAIRREGDETQAALEPELRAHDELDALPLRRFLLHLDERAHHARDRALIRYGDRFVLLFESTRNQFLGMRGPAKKRKITEAM